MVGQSLRITAPAAAGRPRRADPGRPRPDRLGDPGAGRAGRPGGRDARRRCTGRRRISFPARTASRLRADDPGHPQRAAGRVGADLRGRLRRGPDPAVGSAPPAPCVPVSTVDGHAAADAAGAAGHAPTDAVPWVGCGSLLPRAGAAPGPAGAGLAAGPAGAAGHRSGWGERRPPPGPRYAVTPGRAGSATVRVSSARRRLVSDQRAGVRPAVAGERRRSRSRAADPRRRVRRRLAGRPARHDARRDDPVRPAAGHRRRAASLSGAAVLGCLALLVLRAPPRRIPPGAGRRTPGADRSRPRPAGLDRRPLGGAVRSGRRLVADPRAGGPRPTGHAARPAAGRRPERRPASGATVGRRRHRDGRRPAAPVDGRTARRPAARRRRARAAGRHGGRRRGGRWRCGRRRRRWPGRAVAGGRAVRRVAGLGRASRCWRGCSAAWRSGVAAAVLAAWHLVRPPRPADADRGGGGAARGGAGGLAGASAGHQRPGLSAQVVADDLWPHRLTALACCCSRSA